MVNSDTDGAFICLCHAGYSYKDGQCKGKRYLAKVEELVIVVFEALQIAKIWVCDPSGL